MFKKIKNKFKKKTVKNKDEQSPLVEQVPRWHTETLNAGEQENTVDAAVPSGSSELNKIEKLRKILSEISDLPDSEMAPVVQERSLSQVWDRTCLQQIDQFVENHFPELPAEGTEGSPIHEFLQSTQSVIYSKVLPITPQLEEIGLRDTLIDSYSRGLFTNLDLLLNRDLSEDETLCLLLWANSVFFSADSQMRVYDSLLLTGWFERAKQKLLQLLQIKISTFLQKILEEQYKDPEELKDEEKFLSLHIDVIQFLNAAVEGAKKIGLTFKNEVQKLCSAELHDFVQKYVDAENKCLQKLEFTEENSVYLFWIMNTCLQFGSSNQNNQNMQNIIENSNTKHMLQELENNTSLIIKTIMKSIAQVNLRIYFKKNNGDIGNLIEAVQEQCASLPEMASKIKRIIVEIAYNCVSEVYLECLLKTKNRKLEDLWGNVERKIKEDVQQFHDKISELTDSTALLNQLLKRMTEVLWCSDIDGLKMTCGALVRDFPEESEQFVPGLLRWKGDLSKHQVQEVLDAIQDQYPNPRHSTCFPLSAFGCFFPQ